MVIFQCHVRFQGCTVYKFANHKNHQKSVLSLMRQQWWDSLGAPQRALGGWQLFPFKTKTTEVQGYGFSDGTTGQGRFFEGLPFTSIHFRGILGYVSKPPE